MKKEEGQTYLWQSSLGNSFQAIFYLRLMKQQYIGEQRLTHSGIKIINFDERWIKEFKSIKQVISKSLSDLIIDIEHVGSASVLGLGAKPILDIDIVIEI
ncbi:GrpB family protein [Neobacillus vireti]